MAINNNAYATRMCVLLESVKKSVRECAVCEASMAAFDELLGDPSLQKDVEQLLKKVCPKLPAKDQADVRSYSSIKYLSTYRPILSYVSMQLQIEAEDSSNEQS